NAARLELKICGHVVAGMQRQAVRLGGESRCCNVDLVVTRPETFHLIHAVGPSLDDATYACLLLPDVKNDSRDDRIGRVRDETSNRRGGTLGNGISDCACKHKNANQIFHGGYSTVTTFLPSLVLLPMFPASVVLRRLECEVTVSADFHSGRRVSPEASGNTAGNKMIVQIVDRGANANQFGVGCPTQCEGGLMSRR